MILGADMPGTSEGFLLDAVALSKMRVSEFGGSGLVFLPEIGILRELDRDRGAERFRVSNRRHVATPKRDR
ncbi:MAG: hypothetical protein WDM86_03300 [Rhizomicrobium sp.]